jgi:hypothetical protein
MARCQVMDLKPQQARSQLSFGMVDLDEVLAVLMAAWLEWNARGAAEALRTTFADHDTDGRGLFTLARFKAMLRECSLHARVDIANAVPTTKCVRLRADAEHPSRLAKQAPDQDMLVP